jgi:hypothetical protein
MSPFKIYQLTQSVALILLLLISVETIAQDKERALVRFKYQVPKLSTFSKQLKGYGLASDIVYQKKNTYGRQTFFLLASSKSRVRNQQLVAGLKPLIVQASIKKNQFYFEQVIPLDFSDLKRPGEYELDLEGLALAPDKIAWVADESSPALYQLNIESGRVLSALWPGHGLPKYLKNSPKNRGFEGLAVFPNGDLLVSLQSVLKQDLKSKQSTEQTSYIRILRYNPATKATTTYAYPISLGQYQSLQTIKIGALQVVDNQSFLLLEHGRTANKQVASQVFRVNLSSKIESQAQQVSNEPSQSLYSAQKTPILNLAEIGWHYQKSEGLTFFGDSSVLALVNDATNKEPTEIWMVELAQPIIKMGALGKTILWITLLVFAGFFYFVFKLVLSKGFFVNTRS